MSKTSELVTQNWNKILSVTGLEIVKKSSQYITVKCLSCSHNSAFIYVGKQSVICNRQNSCGHKTSFFDIIGKEKFYKIFSNSYELPKETSHIYKPIIKTKPVIQESFFSEDIYFAYHENLIYSQEAIKYIDIRNVFCCAKLLGYCNKRSSIVLFHRDLTGKITSFTFRPLIGKKYYKPKGHVYPYPYLYFEASKIKDTLYVVDGYFDALSLHAHGLRSVAIGSAILNKDKQEAVSKIADKIVFCCDNDSTNNILIKQIESVDLTLFKKVDFLDPKKMRTKDLSEFFLNKTKQNFLDLDLVRIK